MYFELKDATADILAQTRRHDDLCDLPLDLIASEREAYDIQGTAQDTLGFERKGYAIVGTTDASRRTLGLTRPIYSQIPTSALLTGAREFRIPPGTIGVQCEFVFTMLRPFPAVDETINLESVADAILGCRPAIGILGRRTRRVFTGDNAAIADFGLHVATICGDYSKNLTVGELADIDITTFLFKQTVFSGNASSVMGHPLHAVAWLACETCSEWQATRTERRRGHRVLHDDPARSCRAAFGRRLRTSWPGRVRIRLTSVQIERTDHAATAKAIRRGNQENKTPRFKGAKVAPV